MFEVTPISTARPTADELAQNEVLAEWIRANGLIETPDDMLEREEVLVWLVLLVKSWANKVAEAKDVRTDGGSTSAKLYTFGSYRLGVHGPGDDIDAHCVGPRWCERATDFFGTRPGSLEQMLRSSKSVDRVSAVPDAFVPVIKLTVRGIDVDLTYAQLSSPHVPPDMDLQAMRVLRGMSDESVRSINGCRVTDRIVQLVPNRAEFSLALRYLKAWGKRRGVYGNAAGYLGGINFAIMTCYVAMLFPNQCGAVLVQRFFAVLNAWNWSVPIRLAEIETGGFAADKLVWDSRHNFRDGRALLPIITPCYPANNSAHNVLECTKAVLLAELKRGRELSAGSPTRYDLDALAERARFDDTFKNFLCVTIAASSAEDFRAWSGYMGSKIRLLAAKLQTTLTCRPWPEQFVVPREQCADGQLRGMWFIGVKSAQKRVDLRSHAGSFLIYVTGWVHMKIGMTVDVQAVKTAGLPGWLRDDQKRPADSDVGRCHKRLKVADIEWS